MTNCFRLIGRVMARIGSIGSLWKMPSLPVFEAQNVIVSLADHDDASFRSNLVVNDISNSSNEVQVGTILFGSLRGNLDRLSRRVGDLAQLCDSEQAIAH